ncbi:hypothetical protein ABZW11_43050 [Nonomuraea sp. NPDC004580]|uniref:hypothetical protein n=1 Tax=Nonomuraea sp. NPDC004580 TaxID=3154552 RepID=UPI0033BE902A
MGAIEGLLALAQTRPRWSRSAALNGFMEAIARSRVLAERAPREHTELLARCLRTTAKHLLAWGRFTEALPLAQEAVAVSRSIGGGSLVVCLHTLASVQEALHRYSDAAAALAEADAVPPDED